MDVAIIGTGNVGGALARALAAAGHTVTISSRSPEEASTLAAEIGAKATSSNTEAVGAADVVIAAVPYPDLQGLLDEIADALDGKVLVEVSNRMNDNPGLAVDGTSNAEQVQERVRNARVVKAFNTILSSHLNDPRIDGVSLDAFVAGNDVEAKASVLDLARSIGFRPIDAGPLESARALEAMGALNIALQIRDGGAWNNGWKLLEPGS
jgi:NADPH-dependent F420 reductase